MSKNPCILIVDDVQANRDLARTILQRAGYDVDTAGSGAAAVQRVSERTYQLVLMDVQMPGMDGLDATRAIRDLEAAEERVPVIALTANVSPDQLESYARAGIDGHLSKPFRRAQILALVDEWRARPGEAAERRADQAGSADTFADVRELLGPVQTERALADFLDHLQDFQWLDPKGPDLERLGRRAHEIIPQAAMFGFPNLADALSTLEERCRKGRDPVPTLLIARRQAAEARILIQRHLRRQ